MGKIGHLRTTAYDAISSADAARDRGHWTEAAQKYTEAVRRHEHRADLKVQLGNCLKESGQYLDAYRAYLSALPQAPSAEVYLQLGHLLKVSGNFYAARALYRHAASMGNQAAAAEFTAFPSVNTGIIRCASEMPGAQGKPPDAARPHLSGLLKHLACVEQNPADPESLRTAAYVLLDLGYHENARAFFELAFLLADRTPESHLRHADIIVQTGLWPAGAAPAFAKMHGTAAPRQRLRELVKITLSDQDIRRSTPTLTEQAINRANRTSPAAQTNVSAATAERHKDPAPELIDSSTMQEWAGEAAGLIRRAYALQSAAAPADADGFGALIAQISNQLSTGKVFISFASGEASSVIDLDAACCRALLNCLSAWVGSSFTAHLGPFASRQLASALGMSTSSPVQEWLDAGLSPEANLRSLLEIIHDILQDEGSDGVSHLVVDRCLAALLGTCVHAMPAPALEAMSRFLIGHDFGVSTWLVFDEIFTSAKIVNQDEVVYAAQKIKHAGSSVCALALLDKFSNDDNAPVDSLCEKAIVSKVCGDFTGAVRLFEKCIEREPGNLFYKRELWSILPEVEDIANILMRNKDDPAFLEFAGSRLNYRMHMRRWEFDDGEQQISDDVLLREIAPEIASEFVQRHGATGQRDQIQHVQLGWRERIARFTRIRELGRIDVVRAKVVSDVDVVGMRVRIDGRTIAYNAVESRSMKAVPAAGSRTLMFNCWVDMSAVPRGLHEIQLVFEQRDSGYFTREEIIYVSPELPSPEKHFSGSTVRLEGPGAGPLDERINGLPSALLAARRSFFSGPMKRILVARADQLGDFVTSIPALFRIKEIFQDAEISCLVTPQNRELAQSLDFFAKVFCINLVYDHATKRRFATLAEQVRLRRELKPESFDMAIDLSPGSDTRPLLRLANARYRVGFKPDQFRWLSFGVDIQTRDDTNGKEGASHSTLISSFVDAVGGAVRHSPHVVTSRVANWEALQKFGIRRDVPFVVLHSGARLQIKRWPVGHYVELARMTARESGLHTVLFLENPTDRVFLGNIDIPGNKLHVIDGPVTFEELDSLLSFCSVFVGNDTGPKHLAALRGVPVVSIHMGQVNWDEWGQEGDGVIVTRNVPCYGCGIEDAAECGKDLACLVHIRPREAYDAVLSLLAPATPALRLSQA
jgi:ADP-heptose:LPS heptosyltransferase/tetratricopeptide (TPR) repeat protein